MTPQRWTRIREVFFTARQSQGRDRFAYLDTACRDDPELRVEIEDLLAADTEATLAIPIDLPSADSRLAPGDRIAHYRIEAPIGEGGMGVVYKAWDEQLERAVAIKTIGSANGGAAARERLWQEARSLAKISHPNVCQVYGAETDGEALYLVLELLDGETLASRLRRGALAVADAIHVLRQILAALDTLHTLGIVHRDLKPSNVFLTAQGVKLLDFGLSRRTCRTPAGSVGNAPTQTAQTIPGTLIGTPQYMSPEQAAGGVAGPAADIFAAGCIFYQILSGRPAFNGDSVVDILYQVMHGETPVLDASEAALFNSVIARSLSKQARDRYTSAEEMMQAVEQALASAEPRTRFPTRALMRLIVLPFRILRKDDEMEFLAYSLPDAISNSLSGVDSLTVRSTLVALRFEGQALDPRRIAVDADVNAIVAGSLVRATGQLRLSWQLMEAPSGTLIASDVLNVSINDLFQVQDRLAHQIVTSLMLPLTARESRILRHDVPGSAKAYEYYLRANQLSLHRTLENMTLARDLYRQCLEEDANYAPAWASIGRVHRFLEKFGPVDRENSGLADEEFRRAFQLNPDLALAHNFYTPIECDQGRAHQAMVRLLERARFRQHDPDLFAGLVQACRYCGELGASLNADERARSLDAHVITSAEHTYFLLGQYQKTLTFYDNRAGYYLDAAALAALDHNEEALQRLRHREEIEGTPGVIGAAVRSLKCCLEGDLAGCLRALPDLETPHQADPETLFYIARHLARLRQGELAIKTLRHVVESGFLCAVPLGEDPWLASLPAFPGFDELSLRLERKRREVHSAFLQAGGDEVLKPV